MNWVDAVSMVLLAVPLSMTAEIVARVVRDRHGSQWVTAPGVAGSAGVLGAMASIMVAGHAVALLAAGWLVSCSLAVALLKGSYALSAQRRMRRWEADAGAPRMPAMVPPWVLLLTGLVLMMATASAAGPITQWLERFFPVGPELVLAGLMTCFGPLIIGGVAALVQTWRRWRAWDAYAAAMEHWWEHHAPAPPTGAVPAASQP